MRRRRRAVIVLCLLVLAWIGIELELIRQEVTSEGVAVRYVQFPVAVQAAEKPHPADDRALKVQIVNR